MNLHGGIGERIRTLREAAGITLADLARKLATHPSNIQRWEQGRVSPNWRSLARIADALGVSVESLVSDVSTEPQAPRGISSESAAQGGILQMSDAMESESLAFPSAMSLNRSEVREESSCGREQVRPREAWEALMRLEQDPRLRALREALGELPADITAQEAHQIAEIIRGYIRARR
jgi:transcriptional regulator with XRE-family HTH domain